MEHGESDEEFELVPEEEEANRTIPVPRVERNGNKEWSRNRNLRDDLDFHHLQVQKLILMKTMKQWIFSVLFY